jgi:NADH:ubiquinone oxidoreductase subunit K
MRCSNAAQQLQLYLDNQLTIEQARPLEAHLADCAACLEELALLEEVAFGLQTFQVVAEPDDLNEQIMQRVAVLASQRNTPASRFSHLRLSLPELLVAALLATIATLGLILQQPALRALLPLANGHDSFSLALMNLLHYLMTVDPTMLILALWVIGTVLGICITLVVAGNEMRSQWFKAVMDRLPVR